jgi:hypothetical protein
MIAYFRHNEIDKIRWDSCISRSLNRRIYAFSWYLDLVCPGWDALVEDDYASVFPLTHHRKWGISYLAQPFFTQQLGLFSPHPVTSGQLSAFISAIPARFKFVEIQLNAMNPFDPGKGQFSERVNYELDLSASYADIAGSYVQNTRRNLRKAGAAGVIPGRSEAVDDLIGLFRENYGRKEGKLDESNYTTLKKIICHAMEDKSGFILKAGTEQHPLSASAFFLTDASRVYFLFAASAPEARENGAMFVLIDRFIAEQAGKPLTLDFEGGNDPKLGRFYHGFGAGEVPYPALKIDRLSKVAGSGLYLMRKLKK